MTLMISRGALSSMAGLAALLNVLVAKRRDFWCDRV